MARSGPALTTAVFRLFSRGSLMVGLKRKEIFFFSKTKHYCISAQTYCVLVAVGGLISLVISMKSIVDLCLCPKVGM